MKKTNSNKTNSNKPLMLLNMAKTYMESCFSHLASQDWCPCTKMHTSSRNTYFNQSYLYGHEVTRHDIWPISDHTCENPCIYGSCHFENYLDVWRCMKIGRNWWVCLKWRACSNYKMPKLHICLYQVVRYCIIWQVPVMVSDHINLNGAQKSLRRG